MTAAALGIVYGTLTPKAGHGGTASGAVSPPASPATHTAHPPASTQPSPSGADSSPAPTGSDGYTLVYGHRTLSLKGYNYSFDLRTGTVSGSETAWSAGTDAGGDGNGAFEQAPQGSTFCLRDTTNGDIAVITVTDVDHGNYATTDDITYYRHRS
ncbi:hypothetical protein ABZX95_44450 [Streptomyces sp. NPDC004232]|uniref:hypothetical protein n=1 Tax=Streptomyces sp. NPDC004232 TaxID=3154454 RepID=UPI0033A9F80A